jgi:hypothetical protein
LTAFLTRDSSNKRKREKQNKILDKHEQAVIEGFIGSLLIYNILFTMNMMFDAVESRKQAQHFGRAVSTKM